MLRGRGTGGQLGHVTVQFDGLPCVCGRLGCVETTSSGTAFGRLVAEAGLPTGTRAEALLDREAAGDRVARAILDAWALPLRAAIDSVVAAVDPEVVLLGGGLGAAAHRALARAPSMSAWTRCPVVPAQLGDDAGVIGAAVSALVEHLIAPEPPRRPGRPARGGERPMKRAILVNGIPASGKSTVARGLAGRLGCPLMTLDTVKDPLFDHFGIGDREHNRKLGRASYAIVFAAIGDWPDGTSAVIDAWFGFQPLHVLDRHLASAGLGPVVEVWCHAPPDVLAERYRARLETRGAGHPGADYIPELIALAARAVPTGRAPVFAVDTTATRPGRTSWPGCRDTGRRTRPALTGWRHRRRPDGRRPPPLRTAGRAGGSASPSCRRSVRDSGSRAASWRTRSNRRRRASGAGWVRRRWRH